MVTWRSWESFSATSSCPVGPEPQGASAIDIAAVSSKSPQDYRQFRAQTATAVSCFSLVPAKAKFDSAEATKEHLLDVFTRWTTGSIVSSKDFWKLSGDIFYVDAPSSLILWDNSPVYTTTGEQFRLTYPLLSYDSVGNELLHEYVDSNCSWYVDDVTISKNYVISHVISRNEICRIASTIVEELLSINSDATVQSTIDLIINRLRRETLNAARIKIRRRIDYVDVRVAQSTHRWILDFRLRTGTSPPVAEKSEDQATIYGSWMTSSLVGIQESNYVPIFGRIDRRNLPDRISKKRPGARFSNGARKVAPTVGRLIAPRHPSPRKDSAVAESSRLFWDRRRRQMAHFIHVGRGRRSPFDQASAAQAIEDTGTRR